MPERAKQWKPPGSPAPKYGHGKRPSPSKRGYGAAWRRVRAAFLAEHPWCEACLKKPSPCHTPSVVADHREGKGPLAEDGLDHAALSALCRSCHSRKTAKCDGGWGREREAAEGG